MAWRGVSAEKWLSREVALMKKYAIRNLCMSAWLRNEGGEEEKISQLKACVAYIAQKHMKYEEKKYIS